jgi:hypothetical protein
MVHAGFNQDLGELAIMSHTALYVHKFGGVNQYHRFWTEKCESEP